MPRGYQNTGLHSRCALVNSQVPTACPVFQPYVPAAAACEGKEQGGHDLGDPREGGDRGQLADQVADVQPVGVDGGEQQCAVPET